MGGTVVPPIKLNMEITSNHILLITMSQEPSSRRVQAFIESLYRDRLKTHGYSKQAIEQLTGKFRRSMTLLDNGKLACLLCDPWAPYCPDYDRGLGINCQCQVNCDLKTDYCPRHIFDTFQAINDHFKDVHHRGETMITAPSWGWGNQVTHH